MGCTWSRRRSSGGSRRIARRPARTAAVRPRTPGANGDDPGALLELDDQGPAVPQPSPVDEQVVSQQAWLPRSIFSSLRRIGTATAATTSRQPSSLAPTATATASAPIDG